MAAAALSRSRGVAGGLYILFTLLCLVCLASSRIDNDKLKNLREVVQKTEKHFENLKAKRATISELMSEAMTFNEAMIAFAEEVSEEIIDDFPSMKGLLGSARRLMEKSKTHVDEDNEMTDAKIADIEVKLGKAKKALQDFEEHHAEL